MARPESRAMALVGNGAQSEFQAVAFHHMLGIRELRLFDTDAEATAKLKLNLESLRLPGLTMRSCASIAEAVRGADIVTSATADKRNACILTPEMIEPGMHLNAVGGDCPGKTELHTDILQRPDARIVVEFEPQARIEGEIQQLDAAARVIELADVVSAKLPGRLGAADVSIFDSVGFALNDFSALRYLHRLEREHGGGSVIDLIPRLDDPKDLFGELKLGSSIATPGAARQGSLA
jgi:ornithine cyclodeaminase